jgi:glycogen operon protein
MGTDCGPGQSFPLGATIVRGGVNFSLFSKRATAVELLLFDGPGDRKPSRVIPLDPRRNRTYYYWHVFVPGTGAGQLYGYRVHGPNVPARGLRFDGSKVLLDPYTRAVVTGPHFAREAALHRGDNCAQALRSVVFDARTYDWEGDAPLRRPFAETVIYELHVGGFTRHPSSGVGPQRRGTYAGLIEKIPYLRSLGITAVELLPVLQFDEQDVAPPLSNYWGYSPLAFFAPHAGYSSRRDPLGPILEFRDMVKALHRAGIEVILDVVFNHTAEGDQSGPTYSFRGLENTAYYILGDDPAYYANYSGCGNTLKSNHSIVRRMILDCLRYWVSSMHVDGFRFDLASILSRDERGQPLPNPPVLWDIESDPVLSGTKIIAEAWDAGGLYQVGSFVGHRWAEWNGPFRDEVRRFVRGDENVVRPLLARITGSRDLFPAADREPNRSINFVTCHDGFTLNDLVSFNEKHNAANRQGNRDGADANFSANHGAEGPTADPGIEALRLRQVKNFLTILFVSQGTPMLLMGDEVRRTQRGNNNAYCQDNRISWFDWRDVERHAALLRFVRELIAFTQWCQVFREESFWQTEGPEPRIVWHGVRLGQPDLSSWSRSLAFTLRRPECGTLLHLAFNAFWEPLEFELPPIPATQAWHRVVDTALAAPEDCRRPADAPAVAGATYRVGARSTVVLLAREP